MATLSPADVRSIGIDAAGPVSIEKCAGSLLVRLLFHEQGRVVKADVIRLNLKNSQLIDTALAAATSALQSRAMSVRDLSRPMIHFAVEGLQQCQGIAVCWTVVWTQCCFK